MHRFTSRLVLGLLVVAWGCTDNDVPVKPSGSNVGGDDATTNSGGTVNGSGGGGSGGESSVGAGGSSPGRGVRMMTWNLENYPLSAAAESAAVALIEQHQPDIIAVQDILEPGELQGLTTALGDYDVAINDDPGAFLRVGLLSRKDTVAIDGAETLFSDDWYAFPRPPLKVHATFGGEIENPFDATLVVIHLKAQIDSESEERRRAACDVLAEWMSSEILAGGDPDIALLGDFNDKLTDLQQWNVFGAFIAEPENFQFLTRPAAEADEFTYIPFESFIDHIVVSGDLYKKYEGGKTDVLKPDLDNASFVNSVSDHRPVFATFPSAP